MPDKVLLGVSTPGGGWCAPAEVMCICGSTCWPHECTLVIAPGEALDLPAVVAVRGGVVLPPCEVCGFSTWPAGGMHAARSIHMRGHERNGDLDA